MTDLRPRLEPGPTHPITIEPHPSRVTVHAGDVLIAETDRPSSCAKRATHLCSTSPSKT